MNGLPIKFNRLELAGSLGDLGTLLPIAIGMVLINGLNPLGLFFTVGIFYIICGLYYRLTVPVQPMKVIGAYALVTAMGSNEILASGLLMGIIMLIIGATGAIYVIGKYVEKPVVRGVQLSTGALLMAEGVRFILGESKLQTILQKSEPHLLYQNIGFLPTGIIIGVAGVVLALIFLNSRKLPAGLVIVLSGVFLGILIGSHKGVDDFSIRLTIPQWMPFAFPNHLDFTFAFFALILPQLPMTIGNAVIANADLSEQYFGAASKRVNYRSLCITMAFGNFLSFFFGGMPLCHGAGGLASHYRFGARTAGSNLLIGSLFILLVIMFGPNLLSILNLLPLATLGVLLLFSGSQLALTIRDLESRKDVFIAVIMLGITLASNLAIGFAVGLLLGILFKYKHISV